MVDLALVKRHLNVEHDEDDVFIGHLVSTALAYLSSLINRPVEETLENGKLPEPLKHAVLILVARYYEEREGLVRGKTADMSHGLSALCLPYRKER